MYTLRPPYALDEMIGRLKSVTTCIYPACIGDSQTHYFLQMIYKNVIEQIDTLIYYSSVNYIRRVVFNLKKIEL